MTSYGLLSQSASICGRVVELFRRTDRGAFQARVDGRQLHGWSATVGEMREVLCRFGVDPAVVTGADVSEVEAAEDLDNLLTARLDRSDWIAEVREAAGGPQRSVLRDRFATIRDQLPSPDVLEDWLATRAEQVNAAAPQVERLSVFEGDSSIRYVHAKTIGAIAGYLDWVDPRLVVSTLDLTWGVFDRAEPHRRSLVGACAALRAAGDAAGLDRRIDDFLFGLMQPVELIRVEGPGGPVFELRSDGTHRVHFARIFDLPVLAWIRTSGLPQPLLPSERPLCNSRFRRFETLWRGLIEHGLLEVEPDPQSPTCWIPRRVTAEWMLMPPEEAVPVNRAYDRLYPGVLHQVTGFDDDRLFDPGQWYRAVAAAPPHANIRGGRRPRARAVRAPNTAVPPALRASSQTPAIVARVRSWIRGF